jgi:hypothetical protein
MGIPTATEHRSIQYHPPLPDTERHGSGTYPLPCEQGSGSLASTYPLPCEQGSDPLDRNRDCRKYHRPRLRRPIKPLPRLDRPRAIEGLTSERPSSVGLT